jgi:hypothetical protein
LVSLLNLPPILLCFGSCFVHALGAWRFLPIVPVYLLVFWRHFVGFQDAGPFGFLEFVGLSLICVLVYVLFFILAVSVIITRNARHDDM